MTDAAAPSTTPVTEDEPLICPNCGYDLRAAVDGRCSECGLVIDSETLRTSGFPWAHRRERGRVRSYLKTVLLVIGGSRSIAYEAARPQEPRDARSFRIVTAVLLTMALLTVWWLLLFLNDGYGAMAVQPEAFRGMNVPNKWLQDVLVPWSAAVTLPVVMPVMLVGLAFHLTGAHRRMFRLRGRSPRLRERARAIANYASAALLLILPPVMWWYVVELFARTRQYPRTMLDTALLPAWLLLGIAAFVPVLRIVQWSMRVRHAGAERAVIDVPYLLALWSLALVVWLLLLPWCVGFLWIVWDSLR